MQLRHHLLRLRRGGGGGARRVHYLFWGLVGPGLTTSLTLSPSAMDAFLKQTDGSAPWTH